MLAGKKWRNIENIRGKRGGEKLKNAEMRGINNNIRCFEIPDNSRRKNRTVKDKQ